MAYVKIVIGLAALVLLFLLVRKFFHWIVVVLVLIGLFLAYHYLRYHNLNFSGVLLHK